jgi:hypothetical protein
VLLYEQQGKEQDQLWIQEKTGERWFWVLKENPQFHHWIQERPVVWVQEKPEGAWVHFESGQGPSLETERTLTWYHGQKQGETWIFSTGELLLEPQWIPLESKVYEYEVPLYWVEEEQVGHFVLVEEPAETFFFSLNLPLQGASRISSQAWNTSLPRWSVGSGKYPVSSHLRIPTSANYPVSSRIPLWRTQQPLSSWAYPFPQSKPEKSTWIYPYPQTLPPEKKVFQIPTSRPYLLSSLNAIPQLLSSWTLQNSPHWTQPYLRWTFPEELWERPILPSSTGFVKSSTAFILNLSPLPLEKAPQRLWHKKVLSPWKKISSYVSWTLPRLSSPLVLPTPPHP